MKKLYIILTAGLLCGLVYAAQDTSITEREVRDPKRLGTWLESNASDTESRVAKLEGGAIDGDLSIAGTMTVTSTNGTSTNVVITADAEIDGEYIADDTIDNDSIDWSDMTDLDTDGTVTWDNIAEGELGASKVTSSNIKDDEIVDADINSAAAIAHTKLAAVAPAYLLVGNASSQAVAVAVSGDVAIDNAGAVTIAAGSVEESMLSTATQDKIAYTTIAVVDSANAGTGTVTIQLKDAAGNDLAARAVVETWIGNSDDYLPDAETDYSVSTGGSLQEIVANAHYKAVTDTNGEVVMAVDCGGLSTNYVWASVGGRIAASGEVVFTAP